jgi:KipI family sensor histidine kinase inhibitor
MSYARQVRPAGDHSVLLELDGNASVHAVAALARERFADLLVDVVPGHTTLLLVCHPGSAPPDFSELVARDPASSPADPSDAVSAPEPPAKSLRVSYDGEDLPAIAQTLGIDRERVIELHCAPTYTVAFMGFAPGFPYLIGLPPELELPRLVTPRVDVPAGSVAVAAAYCGIYPRSSPGGWNLLGRTDVTLFDADHHPPALLAPGDQVRFEPA